jgi:hypothetical protein
VLVQSCAQPSVFSWHSLISGDRTTGRSGVTNWLQFHTITRDSIAVQTEPSITGACERANGVDTHLATCMSILSTLIDIWEKRKQTQNQKWLLTTHSPGQDRPSGPSRYPVLHPQKNEPMVLVHCCSQPSVFS